MALYSLIVMGIDVNWKDGCFGIGRDLLRIFSCSLIRIVVCFLLLEFVYHTYGKQAQEQSHRVSRHNVRWIVDT